MPRKRILLTPGPTPVPPEVLKIQSQPLLHHRTPEYRSRFRKVVNDLKLVFRTKNPVYVFASSGTGAMEASVVNFLSEGDKVLVLANGKFSERFCHIAESYRLRCRCLKNPYGTAMDLRGVEKELAANPDTNAVFATLCETSTGVLNDIAGLGEVVAKTNAILVVDAISGLLAERFETDAWRVDVAVSGSQKGLMIPPGLAFIAVSPKAERRMQQAKLPRFYFDLKLYASSLKQQDTPFTPAISLVLGLQKALERIKRKGVDKIVSQVAAQAEATRAAVQAAGLKLFARTPSNVLTAICVPEGLDAKKILQILSERYGVTIAGGQGELQGRILRIAHLGFIQTQDLITGLNALESVLDRLGYRCRREIMVQTFRKILSEKRRKRSLSVV